MFGNLCNIKNEFNLECILNFKKIIRNAHLKNFDTCIALNNMIMIIIIHGMKCVYKTFKKKKLKNIQYKQFFQS